MVVDSHGTDESVFLVLQLAVFILYYIPHRIVKTTTNFTRNKSKVDLMVENCMSIPESNISKGTAFLLQGLTDKDAEVKTLKKKDCAFRNIAWIQIYSVLNRFPFLYFIADQILYYRIRYFFFVTVVFTKILNLFTNLRIFADFVISASSL